MSLGDFLMLKEFKIFALRGNMLDLAVGVIVGGGFGKIVTSFVNDILMPPFGLVLGRVNFVDLYLVLSGSVPVGTPLSEAISIPGVVTWNYGSFINTVIDFTIIAFSVFLLIKAVNKMHQPPAEPTTRKCPYCTSDIPLLATRCPHCTSQLSV
jgi:large conductance mechanosensitive channel